jgi:hypothetical protein
MGGVVPPVQQERREHETHPPGHQFGSGLLRNLVIHHPASGLPSTILKSSYPTRWIVVLDRT